MRRNVRGSGTLDVEQQEEVIDMIRASATTKDVSQRFGVSRNTVIGIWNRHGEPMPRVLASTTLDSRLDALHAKMGRVLAENVGVGRLRDEQ